MEDTAPALQDSMGVHLLALAEVGSLVLVFHHDALAAILALLFHLLAGASPQVSVPQVPASILAFHLAVVRGFPLPLLA